jgi:hypothetical protein
LIRLTPVPAAEAGAAVDAIAPASQEQAEEPRKKIKNTGKHVQKLAGTTPKISKNTAEFAHKGFAQLS